MNKRDWLAERERSIYKSLDYQGGFSDGYREGFNRALEQLRDLMHQAINHIPNHYTIVAESMGGYIMRTVSLEMAEKLREVGLRWEPKAFDKFSHKGFRLPVWYVQDGEVIVKMALIHEGKKWIGQTFTEKIPIKECIWLPTLSDLLEWLEGQGYVVNIVQEYVFNDAKPHYCCNIWEKGIDKLGEYWREAGEFKADTREDAAAKAVLWVLEQEAASMGRR